MIIYFIKKEKNKGENVFMRKIFRKSLLLLLAGTMFLDFVFMGSISVQASGAKAKTAISAYQKFLGQDMIKWSNSKYKDEYQNNGYYKQECFKFRLVDVNRDGIPELFVSCARTSCSEGHEAIYSFSSGKVKRVGLGEWLSAYYPSKGVVEIVVGEKYGYRNVWYYKIQGKKKALKLASSDISTEGEKSWYYWRGKEVSKSRFNTLLKKAVGKKKIKIKSSQWQKNTAENRNKMSGWKE